MNISGLVGALLPVFFVLALGYFAGKRNAFNADQAAGLSKLAISYALPASLFVSMTDIPRDLLLQQGPLVLALILAHVGLFLVAWIVLGFVKSLEGTPAILYALMLATSATPVFGLAVLGPILGPTATGAVGLVALSINLVVPAAVVLLEVDAAKHRGVTKGSSRPSPILTGLSSGLKSPLLWGPILGIAIVLFKMPLPRVIAACFQLIGSTTSGVAVFAVGLVLAAHALQVSRVVLLGTLGRLVVQNVPCSLYCICCMFTAHSRANRCSAAVFRWQLSSCSLRRDTSLPNLKQHPCFCCQHFHWQSQSQSSSGSPIIGQCEQLAIAQLFSQ
jgi:malonate transporter and related proteins